MSTQLLNGALTLRRPVALVVSLKMTAPRNCGICQAPPPRSAKSHFKHYGALCCFSCKAFFKYAIDKELIDATGQYNLRGIQAKCRGNPYGKCNVNFEVKHKCWECRYRKCVDQGMDKSLIKQGSERQKFTRKKLTGFKKGDACDARLQILTKAYESSFEKVIQPNKLTKGLQVGHQPGVEWTWEHSQALLQVINLHSNVIVNMVLNHSEFKTLVSEDQNILVENNAKLFKHYILARYCIQSESSTEVVSQLSWLLGPASGQTIDLCAKDFSEINKFAQFIPHDNHDMMDLFKRCLKTIKFDFQYPPIYTGIVGYLTILSTEHWDDNTKKSLKGLEQINKLKTQAEELLCQGLHNTTNHCKLVDSLKIMSFVCKTSVPKQSSEEEKMLESTEDCKPSTSKGEESLPVESVENVPKPRINDDSD